jgi:hypothetical protein
VRHHGGGGPNGPINDAVPQPRTEALTSGSLTHQFSPQTTIAITLSYEYEASDNQGVGGTTLSSAASRFRHHEQQIRYSQQTTLTPSLFLQVQVRVGHERETTLGASDAQRIIVAGAFTGGGAQRDLVRTELHAQINQSLTWAHGHHTVQAGFQLPTGASVDSTTGPILAARSISTVSRRIRPASRTRSANSRGTDGWRCSRSRSPPT